MAPKDERLGGWTTCLDLDQDVTGSEGGQGHLDDAPVLGLLISTSDGAVSVNPHSTGMAGPRQMHKRPTLGQLDQAVAAPRRDWAYLRAFMDLGSSGAMMTSSG